MLKAAVRLSHRVIHAFRLNFVHILSFALRYSGTPRHNATGMIMNKLFCRYKRILCLHPVIVEAVGVNQRNCLHTGRQLPHLAIYTCSLQYISLNTVNLIANVTRMAVNQVSLIKLVFTRSFYDCDRSAT